MNAVAIEIEIERTDAIDAAVEATTHRLHGAEKSWLNAKLNSWGEWVKKRELHSGYPKSEPVTRAVYSPGGADYGHRVLCMDIPERLSDLHLKILSMPEREREALQAYYVPGIRDDGVPFTTREKAAAIGLTEDALWKRVSRARLRILGIEPRLSRRN